MFNRTVTRHRMKVSTPVEVVPRTLLTKERARVRCGYNEARDARQRRLFNRLRLIGSFGCVLTFLAVCRPVPAQTADARARALQLFQKGNEAFAAGNTFDAYDAYARAFSLSPSFDIACNLGRSESEMGKLREGAAHLRYCLKNFPASSRTEMRQAEAKFGQLLSKVAGQLAQVALKVEQAGAMVAVNGEDLGTTPLSESIFLNPGSTQLLVSKVGYTDEVFEFVAQAGSQHEMNVKLRPSSSVSQPARSSNAKGGMPVRVTPLNGFSELTHGAKRSEALHSPPLRTALLIGGSAVTLAGLSLGTVFALQAADEHAAFRWQRGVVERDLGAAGCLGQMGAPSCVQLEAHLESAAKKERVSFFALASASGFGLGTAALWFLWTPTRTQPEISFLGKAHGAEVVVRGAF